MFNLDCLENCFEKNASVVSAKNIATYVRMKKINRTLAMLLFERQLTKLIVVTLFLSSLSITAQEIQIRQKYFSKEQGMASNYVVTVFEDSRGLVWTATNEGLQRFDGIEFQTFSKTNYDWSPGHKFRHIAEDANGNIWVLIRNGEPKSTNVRLDLFNMYTGEPVDPSFLSELPMALSDITGIESDSLRTIWIYTHSGKLYSYDGLEFKVMYSDPLQRAISHFDIGPDRLGLCLNGNYVVSFGADKKIIYEYSLPFETRQFQFGTDDLIFLLKENPDEESAQIYTLDQKSNVLTPFGLEESLSYTKYSDTFVIDLSNRILCRKANQLLAYDLQGNPIPVELKEIDNNFLFSSWLGTCVAKTGRIFLGTGKGLIVISPKKKLFPSFLVDTDLRDIRGITEDQEGNIYVATHIGFSETWKPGVYRINKSTGTYKNIYNLGSQGAIRDSNGKLWFGDYGKVIIKYEPVSNIATKVDIPFPIVPRYLKEDVANEKIWIGTRSSGLFEMNIHTLEVKPFKNYGGFHMYKSSSVNHIIEDGEGLWVATNIGIFFLDDNREITRSVRSDNSNLPYDYIHHMHKDDSGIFWLSSAGGGLIAWDQEKNEFEQYTTDNGLSSNLIYAALEDDHENLWLSSFSKLMKFSKTTKKVQIFTEEDGIPYDEFNSLSYLKSDDGSLYFGGSKGICRIDPEVMALRSEPYLEKRIQLTLAQTIDQTDGTTQDITDNGGRLKIIDLSPHQRSLRLKFSNTDLFLDNEHDFLYRLDGIDSTWMETSINEINYSLIPYGSYNLHVKSKDPSRSRPEDDLVIQIRANRPWYLKRNSIGGFLLLGLLIVFIFIRLRLRSIKSQNRRLNQLVVDKTAIIDQQNKILRQKNEELLELNEFKSNYFANISHDLRTPLTMIMGPLEDLMKDFREADGKSSKLHAIVRNARKMKNMINEALDISLAEKKQLQLKVNLYDPSMLLRHCIDLFTIKAQEEDKILQFINKWNKDKVCLDWERMESILSNLLSNALKNTDRGDRIVLKLLETSFKPRHLDHEVPGVSFMVKDNGKGIDPADIPFIFNRFFTRADNLVSKGVGLGLAIVKELTELHGGTIEVFSQPGQGSQFTVTIPLREQDLPAKVVRSSEEFIPAPVSQLSGDNKYYESFLEDKEPEKKKKNKPGPDDSIILVVEDNLEVREYIRSCLASAHFVLLAENGQKAFEMAQKHVPDLIISDVMMPVMEGFELGKKIKDNLATSHIPIIFLTAKNDPKSRLEGLKSGAVNYLSKPFESERLQLLVSNILQDQRLLQEKFQNESLSIAVKKNLPTKEMAFMQKVQNIVEKNLKNEDFGVVDLSKEMGLDRTQIYRKIKKLTGQTVHDYMQHIRLSHAVNMIEQNTGSLSEIAYETGFRSISAFSRSFKKKFGVPPSHYAAKK